MVYHPGTSISLHWCSAYSKDTFECRQVGIILLAYCGQANRIKRKIVIEIEAIHRNISYNVSVIQIKHKYARLRKMKYVNFRIKIKKTTTIKYTTTTCHIQPKTSSFPNVL